VTGGLGVGVPRGASVWVGAGVSVGVGVGVGVGGGVDVSVAVALAVGTGADAVGVTRLDGVAHAARTRSNAGARLNRCRRTPLRLQVQKRRHAGVQNLAMLGLGRQEPLVVDQPRLLLDPIVPALGASVSEDSRAPLAGQRRVAETRFALRAAATGNVTHGVRAFSRSRVRAFGASDPITLGR